MISTVVHQAHQLFSTMLSGHKFFGHDKVLLEYSQCGGAGGDCAQIGACIDGPWPGGRTTCTKLTQKLRKTRHLLCCSQIAGCICCPI